MIAAADLGTLRNLPEPARTAEASRQFEALLLQHLLRTLREAARSEREEDGVLSGSETYFELAEQHLARTLAERGGFGLAKLIVAHVGQAPIPADKTPEGDR
jgi:Rod binding domain-containing protein